jgi:NADPH-dependent curcumin reductase CurA
LWFARPCEILRGPKIDARGIKAGPKDDHDELMTAISATQVTFENILDSVWPFENLEEAIEYLWHAKQVGKVVIKLEQ